MSDCALNKSPSDYKKVLQSHAYRLHKTVIRLKNNVSMPPRIPKTKSLLNYPKQP